MESLCAHGATLRAWLPADAAAIVTICGEPEVCAWDHVPWEHDPVGLAAWVARQREAHAAGDRISLAIAEAAAGVALGWVGLSPHPSQADTWSIGYWVVPEARRRGRALGAARA
ncbi:MAG: GNAT family N-acetyltransferase, partial [Actinomycetota bacterium]|nr:GNAT family N-acetyltransferase [Actinomycetota bacterium]